GTTREAIQRYLSQKGRSAKDVKVTDQLVADLKGEDGRVCPLSCSRGEHPEGDRCIANVKPEKTEKPKASARQRDEEDETPSRRRAKREESRREESRREQSRREESRREQSRREQSRREQSRREASRPKPERAASRPAPQPAARSQASGGGGGGGGGGMV